MTTTNTIIRNREIVDPTKGLDALESQTYTAGSFTVEAAIGKQTVKLQRSAFGSKYPFRCKLYDPRRNDDRRVWDDRKRTYVTSLYDQEQAPNAIIKPACIQLFFQREDGGVFTAYLANYVDKYGVPAWNKFVDDISDQTQGETMGFNITQVLEYLVDHPFNVYGYNNPKYKNRQVCYTENDYLFWEGLALERECKEKAALEHAEKKRQLKAKREIEASAHQMAVEIEREQA